VVRAFERSVEFGIASSLGPLSALKPCLYGFNAFPDVAQPIVPWVIDKDCSAVMEEPVLTEDFFLKNFNCSV
jgi:hypothetical protein